MGPAGGDQPWEVLLYKRINYGNSTVYNAPRALQDMNMSVRAPGAAPGAAGGLPGGASPDAGGDAAGGASSLGDYGGVVLEDNPDNDPVIFLRNYATAQSAGIIIFLYIIGLYIVTFSFYLKQSSLLALSGPFNFPAGMEDEIMEDMMNRIAFTVNGLLVSIKKNARVRNPNAQMVRLESRTFTREDLIIKEKELCVRLYHKLGANWDKLVILKDGDEEEEEMESDVEMEMVSEDEEYSSFRESSESDDSRNELAY
jgi:hypothetical protein